MFVSIKKVIHETLTLFSIYYTCLQKYVMLGSPSQEGLLSSLNDSDEAGEYAAKVRLTGCGWAFLFCSIIL